jgi:dihydropteroate synthase
MKNSAGKAFILDCKGKMLDLSTPKVMGILNITPDSFYDGGVHVSITDRLNHAEKMVKEGAAIIDIGAVSTRPGAEEVSEQEELNRLMTVLPALAKRFPETVFSVDTSRSSVARAAADQGAGMINDIYGGRFDPVMIPAVVSMDMPFVMMHMQGTPATMQIGPEYGNVTEEVLQFFSHQIGKFTSSFKKTILDPGFGFGKSVEHNFRLLHDLEQFHAFGLPVLAGLSRKSMINKTLRIKPDAALNGTTVLNTVALLKGVHILRVHDVREAVEAVQLLNQLTINISCINS